jgi:hypothetical protein
MNEVIFIIFTNGRSKVLLEECLYSILNQTISIYRVKIVNVSKKKILVDDNRVEVVDLFNEKTSFEEEYLYCLHPYLNKQIIFIDDDDLLFPNCLHDLLFYYNELNLLENDYLIKPNCAIRFSEFNYSEMYVGRWLGGLSCISNYMFEILKKKLPSPVDMVIEYYTDVYSLPDEYGPLTIVRKIANLPAYTNDIKALRELRLIEDVWKLNPHLRKDYFSEALEGYKKEHELFRRSKRRL